MPSREDRLAELLIHWEDARAGGSAPRPETFCNAHNCTDLLDDFRDMLACFESLRFGDESGETPDEPDAAAVRAGRFRAVKEIGRGGLGVVYLAEDDELERAIALKRMT